MYSSTSAPSGRRASNLSKKGTVSSSRSRRVPRDPRLQTWSSPANPLPFGETTPNEEEPRRETPPGLFSLEHRADNSLRICEIGKEGACRLPQVLVPPRQRGKLAVHEGPDLNQAGSPFVPPARQESREAATATKVATYLLRKDSKPRLVNSSEST